MGTVLVIFSFFWTDNAPCLPLACPPDPPICKNFDIYYRKKKCNEKYVEFDFNICTVLVIFSLFWTDNTPCPSLWPSPICKTVNIQSRKKKHLNENYVEFYLVWVLFLWFYHFSEWITIYFVCPLPRRACPPSFDATIMHILSRIIQKLLTQFSWNFGKLLQTIWLSRI